MPNIWGNWLINPGDGGQPLGTGKRYIYEKNQYSYLKVVTLPCETLSAIWGNFSGSANNHHASPRTDHMITTKQSTTQPCNVHILWDTHCQKLGKIFTGPTQKLVFSLMVISDVYRFFILNKTTFTKYSQELWNPLSNWVPGKFKFWQA